MGPALNIISPCALSLRLSLSRQREERSCGPESLFPLSSPLSKTTGSGSGFLEMSAFVCCVTAVALRRSSSHEVMHRLDEAAEWERREVIEKSCLEMDLYFNMWFIQGKKGVLFRDVCSFSGTPCFTEKPLCTEAAVVSSYQLAPASQLHSIICGWCAIMFLDGSWFLVPFWTCA